MKDNVVLIISGEKKSGKTTFLELLSKELFRQSIDACGFISRAHESNGVRIAYRVCDISSPNSTSLCERGMESTIKAGAYGFHAEAFKFGENIIFEGIYSGSDVIILDEAGPLELRDSGWAKILNEIFVMKNKIIILSARPTLISKLTEKWRIHDPKVIQCTDTSPEELANQISQIVNC